MGGEWGAGDAAEAGGRRAWGAQRASHPRLVGEPREEGHAACAGPNCQEEAGASASSFCEQWGLGSRSLRVGGEAAKTACMCACVRVCTYACVCKLGRKGRQWEGGRLHADTLLGKGK